MPVQLIVRLIAAKVGVNELAVHGLDTLIAEAPLAHEWALGVYQRFQWYVVLGAILPPGPEGGTDGGDATDGPGVVAGP